MALPATPRTRGAFYGDLEAPGALERMVRTTSLRGELVLLHGNSKRRRLLLNLIAQLNGLDIDHILLLAFTPDMCERLRRNRNGAVGCAHSSHLLPPSPLAATRPNATKSAAMAAAAAAWGMADSNYRHWLAKWRTMRRLLEASLFSGALSGSSPVLPMSLSRASST